ncbi:hypothetical protein J2S00_003715, partial [Caldalkalibacillus uzonensis]|nr:hypothetical protein [Caldalkalibacillus uzonensis]
PAEGPFLLVPGQTANHVAFAAYIDSDKQGGSQDLQMKAKT